MVLLPCKGQNAGGSALRKQKIPRPCTIDVYQYLVGSNILVTVRYGTPPFPPRFALRRGILAAMTTSSLKLLKLGVVFWSIDYSYIYTTKQTWHELQQQNIRVYNWNEKQRDGMRVTECRVTICVTISAIVGPG